MISVHKRIGPWRNNVDRFIVLSNFAVSKFAKGGIPSDKMVVKPNFVDLPVPATTCQRSGLLFIGRLSPEKGMDVLLDAASLGQFSVADIRIAGDGPLDGMVTGRDVTFLGALPANEVRQNMQAATALLLPSVWYEGFPMVLVEAYANGLPVIASRLGALAELVEDGVTGLLFEPGNANDLAGKMRWAFDNPNEMSRMGEAARKRYEDLYTPEQNYEQLMEIYRHAIGSHHNKAKLQ
jgi:glycosyltransferase involved in cell wall biosynthesis